VLRGVSLEETAISRAPTMVTRPVSRRRYDYAEELPQVRRRSVWPWVLTLGIVIAAGIAALYLYNAVQEQLNEAKPVAVPYVVDLLEPLAVEKISDAGLTPEVRRKPHAEFAIGKVYEQSPQEGERIDKGNTVVIFVSLGKPKARVPDMRGSNVDDAIAALEARGLKANAVEINSQEEPGTVLAQSIKPDTTVVKGTTVRINVSKGPKPVAVPPVIGLTYDQAANELEDAGFLVARTDVESNEPDGVVVNQDPEANSAQAKGSTVTLQVSSGPSTVGVPDVVGTTESAARDTLVASGLKVTVEEVEVTDPNQDGTVIYQDPVAGSDVDPGARVTIAVGRLAAVPPKEEPPAVPAPVVP